MLDFLALVFKISALLGFGYTLFRAYKERRVTYLLPALVFGLGLLQRWFWLWVVLNIGPNAGGWFTPGMWRGVPGAFVLAVLPWVIVLYLEARSPEKKPKKVKKRK